MEEQQQHHAVDNDDGPIVYSHARPGHIDDVVGTSVLAAALGARVRFLHQQDPVIPAILANGRDALVDVGGHYDPAKLHFDHHQQAELPCAAVLVLRELGDWSPSMGWTYMSIKDVLGPAEAVRATREVPSDGDLALERILSCMPPTGRLGMSWVRAGIVTERFNTFGSLVHWLIDHADARSLQEARSNRSSMEAKGRAALAASRAERIRLPDGTQTKVVLPGHGETLPLSPNEAFKMHSAGLVVMQREIANSEKVWKVTRAEWLSNHVDFRKIRHDDDVVFAHNSGHMAVLRGEMPENQSNLERLVNRVWVA